MSKRVGSNGTGRRTDHSDEITRLRQITDHTMEVGKDDPATVMTYEGFVLPAAVMAAICECAAGLLEVHDATGISLDEWAGPRELVELALALAGYDPEVTFLENGV